MNQSEWVLAAGLLLLVTFIAFVLTRNASRKRALVAAAAEMGFAQIDPDALKVHDLPLFEHRFDVELALEGSAGGYLCNIVEVLIPKGKYSERFTLIAFTSESLNMPMFQAHAHTWTDNIAGVFSSQVVQFPEAPSFDGAISVRAPDAEQLRAFLTPDLQSLLVSACASYTVEAHIGTLALYRRRVRIAPSDLRTFVESTSSIAQGFLSQVPEKVLS